MAYELPAIRESILGEGDAVELVKKAEPYTMKKSKDLDGDAAKYFDDTRVFIKATRLVLEADAKEPMDLATDAGLKLFQKLVESNPEMKSFAETFWKQIIQHLLNDGQWRAAADLRLLELEKGPLVKQKEAALKVVKSRTALKLEWEGDDAIVKVDPEHFAVKAFKKYDLDRPIRLKPAGK
jgi:hypothetical protein